MKVTRAWYEGKNRALSAAKEITEERAGMDLANAHGGTEGGIADQRAAALAKLKEAKELETQYAKYEVV